MYIYIYYEHINTQYSTHTTQFETLLVHKKIKLTIEKDDKCLIDYTHTA